MFGSGPSKGRVYQSGKSWARELGKPSGGAGCASQCRDPHPRTDPGCFQDSVSCSAICFHTQQLVNPRGLRGSKGQAAALDRASSFPSIPPPPPPHPGWAHYGPQPGGPEPFRAVYLGFPEHSPPLGRGSSASPGTAATQAGRLTTLSWPESQQNFNTQEAQHQGSNRLACLLRPVDGCSSGASHSLCSMYTSLDLCSDFPYTKYSS